MSAIKGLLFTAAVTAPLLASVSAEAVVLSQRGTALFGAVGSFTGDFVVDPNTDRVWVSEGFGANGARAFDFSNPDAPVFMGTVAGSGSGAAVNPTTNRFYTIDSFRSPSKIREFDGTANSQTQASIQNSVGCGGALDANKATGAVYATTQCADTLHRYDPTANAITHQVGLGVVGSLVRVNEATGNVYANHGTSTNTKVYNGNDLSLITTLGGVQIRDVNATTNRLYMTDYTNIRILDGSTHGLLGTLLGLGSWQLAVDEINNWIFAAGGAGAGDELRIYDGATNLLLDTLNLGTGFQIFGLATGGDGFVYAEQCLAANCTATRSVTAFEVVVPAPEPGILLLFGAGLAGIAVVRRRAV